MRAAATPVPFFSQTASFESVWPQIQAELDTVHTRGKYSHGPAVERLEHALQAWTGAGNVVATSSGTAALTLLLRAIGIGAGDEVVVPAFTFIASASAVVHAHATPRFADIDPQTWTIDPASAEAAVTERTSAIMPVHLFHQMADMAAVGELARRRGIAVVEDSAEAIGMWCNGVHAGLHGTAGVLSFFPTKTLGAIGDAGAVLTNDAGVAETVAALRHHGRGGRTIDHFPGIANLSVMSGHNAKMDDIQAAVLLAKLGRLAADIERRNHLAVRYTEQLGGIPGIRRLPVVVPRSVPTSQVYYTYVVEVDRRDALVAHLSHSGIGTEVYYPTPLHLQPCFADLGYRAGDFPHAEAACRHAVALPLYPDLSDDALDSVCAAIRGFYTRRSR